MPATTRSTSRATTRPSNGRDKATSTRQASGNGKGNDTGTGTRKPNGGTRGTSSKATAYWPVELTSSGPLDLTLEGRDGDDFGLAICSRCAAVIPGSERARHTHSRFHDLIDAIDQRAGS
jgi:hypothetical protein